MVFRDNHDEEGLHLAEKAQTLLTNLPEPNVDYLYPPRSHMSAFNNSSNQNVGNTDHSYNLKYWLRQCIQNAPENLSWEQLIAQCIQLYISFYKDPTHSSIERESIIPLVINQLAFELGRLHECANPNPTNLAHLQLPNAQRIWQAQVAACFQKASVPEIALCHQLYHQVPAHTVNLPGNLLSFTLSICLSLNLMGMGNQTVVARMVQDIAAECAQSTDQSTLGLFYLVEARLLLSCAGIDHDNSNGTALSPSKTADTTSDFNKALITAGGLLERAQKVFTILDDRDMLNEALYLQCILFHARGLFKKRDNIARRLQQLSATYP
ncbi:hypothetical protein BDF19DRAFT_60306 [Syncephalis fuscata]|nr:hypothetical protein BDF19DRAFT_60306 [Syncephalis fuscata]